MRSKGVTLIELLITATLVSVIGITLYSSLASGINIAQRITRPVTDEDLAIFFEKMSREITNSFHYSGIAFQGNENEFSFPTLIRAKKDLGDDLAIGRVVYSYESSSNTLARRQDDISEVFEDDEGKALTIFKGVTSVTFSYLGFNAEDHVFSWFKEWDSLTFEGVFPLAIQMEMEYLDDGKKREAVRAIEIPVGG